MVADELLPALLASGATSGLAKLASLVSERLRPDHDPSLVPSVAEAQALLALAEELLQAVVAFERAKGTSWEAIGRALGITRSTAHGRFSTGHQEGGEVGELLREVDDKWSRARDLAERATRPMTNTVARLDSGSRDALTRALRELVLDRSLSPQTRIRAAEAVSAVNPEAGERALLTLTKSYLREPLTAEPEEPQNRVDDGSVYRRFMERLSREDPPAAVDEAEVDFLVESYRIVVERTPAYAEISKRAQWKLAWALRLRFTVRGRREDPEQAITLLRGLALQADNRRERMDALIALSAALVDRFRAIRDLRDLTEAREIVTREVRGDLPHADPGLFGDLTSVLLRLAGAFASIDEWRESEGLLHGALGSSREAHLSRETAADLAVRTRLQLACVHAELGEYETSLFDASQAVEEAELNLPRHHPVRILARQLHITVLAERGHRDEDLPAIMRSLDELGRELQAPRDR
jgi:hypothetical protein